MILLIDNYDSFTWNLYQSLAASGAQVEVHRNDALSVDEALALEASGVIFSPGPGRPEGAGICKELLAGLPQTTPFLGVCLGHQTLVEICGGSLGKDPEPMHGKPSMIHQDGECVLFSGLPNPFPAGRYHSLFAVREDLPDSLKLTAWTEDGTVMAVQHHENPWFGVQFHPESILTPQGDRLLTSFLGLTGEGVSVR
ncbi:MAG: aminodeoxychorismate/anthranilate synthase component II [Planctomycetes bacterium]|nr:aminodeoxychorismate/anthranilate synthase component II [Planctomycetota bacterium]